MHWYSAQCAAYRLYSFYAQRAMTMAFPGSSRLVMASDSAQVRRIHQPHRQSARCRGPWRGLGHSHPMRPGSLTLRRSPPYRIDHRSPLSG
ncbi:hypothetical protein BJY00DRAFT_210562 [Aspergillus carlsbadensis]|nr:hypothetical protein BJY00DRAFT_210562 [Aspergillus carlsbadensis]